MATRIITKHSSTPGAAPTPGDLSVGELAVNVADRRLYTKDGDGNAVEVGSGTAIIYRDNFTGDGSTVNFVLARSVLNEELVDIYMDGVYQNKDGWSISGATITFSEAPPLNAAIEVMSFQSAPIGETAANYVEYTPAGTGASITTVQAKLRESVSVKDFGAVGDGVTDDTAAIQAALDYCETNGYAIQGVPGTYLISDKITIKCSGDMSAMQINVDATAVPIAIQVGPAVAAQYLFNADLILPFVTNTAKVGTGWAGFSSSIGVLAANVYQSRITVPSIYNFGIGLQVGGFSVGNVYNTYNIGVLYGNKVNLLVQPGDISGWANENIFINGRYTYSSAEGTAVSGAVAIKMRAYPGNASTPNNNVFIKPAVEGDEAEFMLSITGYANKIINPRCETSTSVRIEFYADTGETTQSNVIDGGYFLQARTITNTGAGTITGNFLVNNQKGGEVRHYSGNGANVSNQTSSAITNPHFQGFPPSVNPFAKTESATDWQYRIYADGYSLKQTTDAHPRLTLNYSGYAYFGRGGAAAIAGLRAGSSGTTQLNCLGTFQPETTNQDSLGSGTNKWKTLHLSALTVATLPSAATAGAGAKAFVSDANATTFASVVAGGGANGVPVYSDGTNWKIG